MAKNDIPANDYRAERKERLAKNAKKSKKTTFDSTNVITTIIRVVCIAVVVALAAFLAYKLEFPHKILPAVEVNGKTYTMAEYSFYYNSVSNTYINSNANLKLTDKVDDGEGGEITYAELFKKQAIEAMESSDYYLKKCEAEGIVLSEEYEQQVSQTLEQLSTYATTNGVSVSRYISLLYGKGLSEKVFTELLREQMLVAQYTEDLEAKCLAEITPDELEAAYAEDPAAYQEVDIRLFGFEIPKDEQKKEETSEETTAPATEETTAPEAQDNTIPTETEILAKEMLDRITDEESFQTLAYEYAEEEDKATFKDGTATLAKSIKKSVVESNIGKNVADWLYSEERVEGDKNVFTTEEYVYVIYIIEPMHRNEEALVDARHILVTFDSVAAELKNNSENKIDVEKKDDKEVSTALTEDEREITNEGTGYSIELVTETYKRANDIYEKFLSGEKTEEAFAALAEEYSDDTGSVGENTAGGGLYEGIERGKMVEPFENWVYDKERQPGNVGLVMTNYGWHIMYFVKQHEDPAWKTDVKAALGAEKFEALSAELEKEISGTCEEKLFYGFAVYELEETLKKNLASMSSADSHEGHNH